MSGIWKISKVRKRHTCDACNCLIEKDEKAFVQSVYHSAYQRYPNIYYYHFSDNFSLQEIQTWSWNDFRRNICSQLANQ